MALTDNGGLSASDVALLTGNNGGNNGWGFGNGDWGWIILLLLFANGGWNNGFGFGGGSGVAENYVLTSDFAQLSRQLESATNSLERKGDFIQEQICNSDQMNAQAFSNLNTNILTQGAGLNNTLATNFAAVNQGISTNRYENQLASNQVANQLQQCCCTVQSDIAGINYNNLQNTNALQSQLANMNYDNAMNSNLTRQAISDGFCQSNYNNASLNRDVIDAINATARATQDMIQANRFEDLRIENDRLRTQLNNANLAASQAAQTNAIDNRIDRAVRQLTPPVPEPAYLVNNPNAPYNGCGCNSCGNY